MFAPKTHSTPEKKKKMATRQWLRPSSGKVTRGPHPYPQLDIFCAFLLIYR